MFSRVQFFVVDVVKVDDSNALRIGLTVTKL